MNETLSPHNPNELSETIKATQPPAQETGNLLEKLGYKEVTAETVINTIDAIKQQNGTKEQATQAVLDLFDLKAEEPYATYGDEVNATTMFGSSLVVVTDKENNPILKSPNVRDAGYGLLRSTIGSTWDAPIGVRQTSFGQLVDGINKAVASYRARTL